MRKEAKDIAKKYFLGIVDMRQSLSDYDRFLGQIEKGATAKALVEGVLRKKPCARVLDLGCGSGQALRELKEKFSARVFACGIDLVEPVDENLPDLFLRGDALETVFPENIDLLFSFRALHEIGETERVFKKICACLASGGKAFLSARLWFTVHGEHKWHGNMQEKDFRFLEKISVEKRFGGCAIFAEFVEVPVGNSIEAGFNIVLKKKKQKN